MIIVASAVKKWRKLPQIAKVAGYIGVVAGAITATATAWAVIEPHTLTRSIYVRGYVGGETGKIKLALDKTAAEITDLKIRDAKKDKATLFRERFQWSAKMKELPDTSAARSDYEWRIRQIDEEIKDVEHELNELRKNK